MLRGSVPDLWERSQVPDTRRHRWIFLGVREPRKRPGHWDRVLKSCRQEEEAMQRVSDSSRSRRASSAKLSAAVDPQDGLESGRGPRAEGNSNRLILIWPQLSGEKEEKGKRQRSKNWKQTLHSLASFPGAWDWGLQCGRSSRIRPISHMWWGINRPVLRRRFTEGVGDQGCLTGSSFLSKSRAAPDHHDIWWNSFTFSFYPAGTEKSSYLLEQTNRSQLLKHETLLYPSVLPQTMFSTSQKIMRHEK